MDILIVTKSDCYLCDLAKEIVDRLSDEWPLSVATLDLSSERGRRIAVESGAAFPPVILLDGELFCYGRLSERRLRRELERRSSAPRSA